MGHPDDDVVETSRFVPTSNPRRRSMISNISFASTADLTSDTGFTSPARTNTPSPPIPDMNLLRLHDGTQKTNTSALGAALEASEANNVTLLPAAKVKEAPRKRCIQFACAKTVPQDQPLHRPTAMAKTVSAIGPPRQPGIRFACSPRPASTQNTPPRKSPGMSRSPLSKDMESPTTPKTASTLAAALAVVARDQSPRGLSNKPTRTRPAFLRANSKEMVKDGSQFHEFATDISREDDWIRQENPIDKRRLTIDDTLTKENQIRRIAVEAEEEAELEEEEAAGALSDEDDNEDDDEDEDEDEDDVEDVASVVGLDQEVRVLEEEDDGSEVDQDGYFTDEETGFAESESDEDDNENMILWTPSNKTPRPALRDTPILRRPSLLDMLSDSSNGASSVRASVRRSKTQRIKPRATTPDLPDSTDFVCGTLDEDRPLEEAYKTNLNAKRKERLRTIPQDIDPSFPTSDPEDEEDEEIYNPVHHSSDDENVWMQGEMEDLHDDKERSRRKKKSEAPSPRKYRSPPPKRHLSPAPKLRCRSPRLFERHSPRRLHVPPRTENIITTPSGTPRQGGYLGMNLAGRPGLTDTKSLPRPPALFPHIRHARGNKAHHKDQVHVRSAIDIVKGLERKRQRRKEKFHQKYCNRARRGQIPDRKPQPGRGAERMKELGLLMAGKKDQGNYVLSV